MPRFFRHHRVRVKINLSRGSLREPASEKDERLPGQNTSKYTMRALFKERVDYLRPASIQQHTATAVSCSEVALFAESNTIDKRSTAVEHSPFPHQDIATGAILLLPDCISGLRTIRHGMLHDRFDFFFIHKGSHRGGK